MSYPFNDTGYQSYGNQGITYYVQNEGDSGNIGGYQEDDDVNDDEDHNNHDHNYHNDEYEEEDDDDTSSEASVGRDIASGHPEYQNYWLF